MPLTWQSSLTAGRRDQLQEIKFPTECFHLTAHCHHIALLPTIRMFKRNTKDLVQLQDAIKEMEKSGSKASSIDKYKSKLQSVMMRQAGLDGVLIEEASLSRVMQFYGSLAEWTVSLLDPNSRG